MKNILIICFLLILGGCAWCPHTPSYHQQYSHLKKCHRKTTTQESEYAIIFFVDARHLDYSSSQAFFITLSKHPNDGSKNGDVGHAWVCLIGNNRVIEGGHSGERGVIQPKYLEGVMDLYEIGDPNPIKYLWETQYDGFFELRGGFHRPTFAAKMEITERQYDEILKLMKTYPYKQFSITKNQCTTFVVSIAEKLGLNLEHKITIKLAPWLHVGKSKIRLWSDQSYSSITVGSPDILEKSLMRAVSEGRLFYVVKP